MKPNKKLTA